jgi:hypothetical protein
MFTVSLSSFTFSGALIFILIWSWSLFKRENECDSQDCPWIEIYEFSISAIKSSFFGFSWLIIVFMSSWDKFFKSKDYYFIVSSPFLLSSWFNFTYTNILESCLLIARYQSCLFSGFGFYLQYSLFYAVLLTIVAVLISIGFSKLIESTCFKSCWSKRIVPSFDTTAMFELYWKTLRPLSRF